AGAAACRSMPSATSSGSRGSGQRSASTRGWLLPARPTTVWASPPASPRPGARPPTCSRLSRRGDNEVMTERPTNLGKRAKDLNEVIRYTMWSVFGLRVPLGDSERSTESREVEKLFDELAGEDVTVRGVYDVAGLRADA